MVCQIFFEANQKSYFMAFPNSHTRVFASATIKAAVLLASRYLFDYFIDPPVLQVRKASFFTLMASLPTSVYQQVLRLPPQQAPLTFWPQLLTAASIVDNLDNVHSDFPVLNIHWDEQKFFLR